MESATKKALVVSDLRGAWREKQRAVREDDSTTCPYSHPANFSLCQEIIIRAHFYSSYQLSSMSIPTTLRFSLH